MGGMAVDDALPPPPPPALEGEAEADFCAGGGGEEEADAPLEGVGVAAPLPPALGLGEGLPLPLDVSVRCCPAGEGERVLLRLLRGGRGVLEEVCEGATGCGLELRLLALREGEAVKGLGGAGAAAIS